MIFGNYICVFFPCLVEIYLTLQLPSERLSRPAKDLTIPPYSGKIHDSVHIKWQHPIAPPVTQTYLQSNILVLRSLTWLKLQEISKKKKSKGTRFGSTKGLTHAYWHISRDSGCNKFLEKRIFGLIHTCTRSSSLEVNMSMLINEIFQELRKLHRLEVFTCIS